MKNLKKLFLALLLIGISVNADLQAMKRRSDGIFPQLRPTKTARRTGGIDETTLLSLSNEHLIPILLGLDLDSLLNIGYTCRRLRDLVRYVLEQRFLCQNPINIQEIQRQLGYNPKHSDSSINLDSLNVDLLCDLVGRIKIIHFLQFATNGTFITNLADLYFLVKFQEAFLTKIKKNATCIPFLIVGDRDHTISFLINNVFPPKLFNKCFFRVMFGYNCSAAFAELVRNLPEKIQAKKTQIIQNIIELFLNFRGNEDSKKIDLGTLIANITLLIKTFKWNLDEVRVNGNTLLHATLLLPLEVLIKEETSQFIYFLLTNGANPNIRNEKHHSASDIIQNIINTLKSSNKGVKYTFTLCPIEHIYKTFLNGREYDLEEIQKILTKLHKMIQTFAQFRVYSIDTTAPGKCTIM